MQTKWFVFECPWNPRRKGSRAEEIFFSLFSSSLLLIGQSDEGSADLAVFSFLSHPPYLHRRPTCAPDEVEREKKVEI